MWKQFKALILSGVYESSSCYTFLKNCSVLPCTYKQKEKAGHMLIRHSGMKFETKAKCVEMPASWATSLHNIKWWPSKSLLTMPTVTTDVTHCCWCFTPSFISNEAYITTTKTTCRMGHCSVICLWFHKFLAIQCVLQGFHHVNFKFSFTRTEQYATFNARYFLLCYLIKWL